MDIFSNIAIGICFFVFFAGVFLLIRNRWVFKNRMQILDNHDDTLGSLSAALDEYRKLPSYEYMLYRKPWIWDIEKFKEGR